MKQKEKRRWTNLKFSFLVFLNWSVSCVHASTLFFWELLLYLMYRRPFWTFPIPNLEVLPHFLIYKRAARWSWFSFTYIQDFGDYTNYITVADVIVLAYIRYGIIVPWWAKWAFVWLRTGSLSAPDVNSTNNYQPWKKPSVGSWLRSIPGAEI